MDHQTLQERGAGPRPEPISPAPERAAPNYARAAWSEDYVAWFVSQAKVDGGLPPDVSPTHLFEVEFAYCMLDPQRYERETQQELRGILH